MQHQVNRVAAVFVARADDDPTTIWGCYTLSNHTVDARALAETGVTGLPRNGLLPATLLGRLAVRMDSQGKGVGRNLLTDAVVRAYMTTNSGSVAITARMKRPELITFYAKLGFALLPGSAVDVYVPMGTIGTLLGLPTVAALQANQST